MNMTLTRFGFGNAAGFLSTLDHASWHFSAGGHDGAAPSRFPS